MNMNPLANVEMFLKSKGIEYTQYEHRAVYTCEEAKKYCYHVPGISCKNLFLMNKKKNRYFLIVIHSDKRADLKKIGEIVGEKTIRFADAQILLEKLGVEPGSVSPMGILNDTSHEVNIYIDRDIYNAPIMNCHPNRNTASLELSQNMFHKFLNSIENTYTVIDF